MPSLLGDGVVALISGFDDEGAGGGMFRYDGRNVGQLDGLPCTGLAVENGVLARVLRGSEAASRASLLLHDSESNVTDVAVDELVDPHDILWTGDSYAIACAGANKIVFVSPAGVVTRVWEAPGAGDAWHLNSLLLVDGELHLSAFGKFERHREWAEPGANPASGFVLNLATGRDVVTGLSSPHHPRLVDGQWIVCNSGRRALTLIDAETGRIEAEVVLDGWTRGLAVLDGGLLVGESPGRTEPKGVSASVAFVDRGTWEVAGRFSVPTREIYDIVLAPSELARSVRRSARRVKVRRTLLLPKPGTAV